MYIKQEICKTNYTAPLRLAPLCRVLGLYMRSIFFLTEEDKVLICPQGNHQMVPLTVLPSGGWYQAS